MSELILGFLIIVLAFIGLAVGLIFRIQLIKVSCGGIANLDSGGECQICGRTDPQSCND